MKFAIIGSGWRARFYLRIGAAFPNRIQITDVLVRNNEKEEALTRDFGVTCARTLSVLLQKEPDFVVLAVSKSEIPPVLSELMQVGVPVLCETPPADSEDGLVQIWEDFQKNHGQVQVAEQYFLQPYYAAWEKVIRRGDLGEVYSVSLSSLHDYHAFSIFRRFLGIQYAPCSISAEEFSYPLVETLGRGGVIQNGEIKMQNRLRASILFSSGQRAFYDFSSAQYHSMIRSRHWLVQGERGEIDDYTLRYINKTNEPVCLDLNRQDFGPYDNAGPTNYALQLGDEVLYKSPFYPSRLNDDEIAVAACLFAMDEYVQSGKEFYPLAEALEDTYLGLCMHRAAKDKTVIKTEKMPWHPVNG